MKSSLKPAPLEKITSKHKAGLLLVSLSTLMLEFTFIRVLSVSLWYHFAFMIISIALLGFGIAGVTIVISDRINKADINKFLSITSLLYSIAVIVSFTIINKIPFDPFSFLVDPAQYAYLPLYYLVITLPFFLAGLIIGQIFTRFKTEINKLYFFDLIGAGLSCFVFIIILPSFGGSGGIIAASLIAALASVVFSLEKTKYSFALSICGALLIGMNILFLTNPEGYFPIRVSDNKIYGTILEESPELRMLTKWNSFSRVDVIRDDEPPVDNYPVYTAIIDAGNSTTNIPQVPANTDSLPPPLDASNLAMVLKRDSANVFIVGSGGGGEILSALSHNAKTVTAVEINGILNDLIEKDFAAHWTTGIAKNKKVSIITDDARGYLRGKRLKFDVIISAHTISASATASGAMSLVENYILTKEAVKDYLRHLNTDGILYITRPEPQIPRLITTIGISFEELYKLDSKKNFFIFKRPPSEFEKDISYLTGIVYKKVGLSEFDVQMLKTQALLMGLEIVYDPVSRQDGIYKDLIESDNIYETVKKYPTKLLPATDDNPYFEHLTDFTDLNLDNIKSSFSQTERAMISLVQNPAAESTLVMILIQAIIISVLLIFLPIYIKFRNKPKLKEIKKGKYILYFAALGLGYIMIEICLIQKFTLFLGQPVYTMLTVISTMLIFSGIGSMFSDKIIKLFRKKVTPVYLIIGGLVILIAFINPIIFEAMVRASITVRIIISVIIIAIPSFFMGIPFPYGIMKISADENSTRYLVAFSWGVNGFFSVLGSILVVMLSMSYGFKVVFIIGALLYFAAMLTARKFEGVKATVRK
jgi:SAM-dependent methyltransferase